jgi:hypothetical protein
LGCGGLAFAGLALSAQVAAAQTRPTSTQAVITVAQDAQLLTPVVDAQTRIIVDGVRYVPDSEPVALKLERMDRQIVQLDSAIRHAAGLVGSVALVHISAIVTRHVQQLARVVTAAKPLMSHLAHAFFIGESNAGWQVLEDTFRIITGTVQHMKGLFGIR